MQYTQLLQQSTKCNHQTNIAKQQNINLRASLQFQHRTHQPSSEAAALLSCCNFFADLFVCLFVYCCCCCSYFRFQFGCLFVCLLVCLFVCLFVFIFITGPTNPFNEAPALFPDCTRSSIDVSAQFFYINVFHT